MSAQGNRDTGIIIRLRDKMGRETQFKTGKNKKLHIVFDHYAVMKGVDVSHIQFFMADGSKEIDDSMHVKTPEMLDLQNQDRIYCILPPNHGRQQDKASNNDNDNDDETPVEITKKLECTEKLEYDLICPITLQLPFEPVTAEDGRVYEKSAIEDYIKSKEGMVLKSPMTRDIMGTKLFPSPQTNNIIENLIGLGVITGDLAKNWQERNRQKQQKQKQKKIDELIKKAASSGDPKQLFNIGWNYHVGQNGFPKDFQAAFHYYDQASLAHYQAYVTGDADGDGDADAEYKMATMLLTGLGVTQNIPKGRGRLYNAACLGSVSASYDCGIALADGKYGFTVDKMEAIDWLEDVVTSQNGSELTKKKAMKKLDYLAEDDPDAAYKIATIFLTVLGVAKNIPSGRKHLVSAAVMGNVSAAYDLGIALADGKYGFTVDKIKAISWLKEVVTSRNGSELTKKKAMKKLEKLEEEELTSELQTTLAKHASAMAEKDTAVSRFTTELEARMKMFEIDMDNDLGLSNQRT